MCIRDSVSGISIGSDVKLAGVTVGRVKKLELDNFSFSLPPKDLLSKSSFRNIKNRELDKINTEASVKLERTLAEYGVEGKIVGFSSGPIVTLFEFIPNAGIKSSKVIGLSDDIARAMSSISARISTQPGKTSLGIEIPNTKRDSVLFGDLIEEDEFEIENDSLTLALGKDISGKSIFANLERMPHLLIAGTTGSGKSVGINTMILSILYKFKPNECKLIFPSTHVVYEGISEVKTDIKEDEATLPVLSYSLSKAENEKQLKESGKNFIILRLGSVYGYSSDTTRLDIMTNLFSKIASQDGQLKLFAGGRQIKSLVPVIDVARCFKFMEEKENLKSFLISSLICSKYFGD